MAQDYNVHAPASELPTAHEAKLASLEAMLQPVLALKAENKRLAKELDLLLKQ